MSNPRKIVDMSTRKISRAEKINRKRQEEELKIDREELEAGAPSWLDEIAAEEFARVVREAGKVPLLDNLDKSVLAVYAAAFSQFVKATIALQTCGYVITNDRGTEIPSPNVAIADKAATKILQCSSKLGLAVTDRLKLVVPESDAVMENPVDKWLKFLPASSGKRRKARADA